MQTVSEQLQALAELLKEGLISREQFEKERDRILSESEKAGGVGGQDTSPSDSEGSGKSADAKNSNPGGESAAIPPAVEEESERRNTGEKIWKWVGSSGWGRAVKHFFALIVIGGLVVSLVKGFMALRSDSQAPRTIEWIQVPGGTFAMGSGDDWCGNTESRMRGFSDEQPVHLVSVGAFEMSATEVTVAQYKECVDGGSCTPPDEGHSKRCTWGKRGRMGHPVNCLDWHQAREFAEWAGGRLPSESEWEYAVRGGEALTDEGGEIPPGVVECWRRGDEGTCPCSRSTQNGFGLSGMAGNVSEWVEDCYFDTYVDAPTNGKPRTECFPVESNIRVQRGVSWHSNKLCSLRVSNRNWSDMSAVSATTGFRIVRYSE